MSACSSGLPRPIFCHRGKTEVVEATGLPLGFFEDATFDELTLTLNPGDFCVFFSDGIIDARSTTGDGFGRSAVERVAQENWKGSAEEIAGAIFEAVAEHSAGVDAFDDQTVVVFKLNAEGSAVKSKTRSARKNE